MEGRRRMRLQGETDCPTRRTGAGQRIGRPSSPADGQRWSRGRGRQWRVREGQETVGEEVGRQWSEEEARRQESR